MKPRIFIGSSVEGLKIAYAIQENLTHDAQVTVWTQGIFQLSSNSLDDLISALENFDFGIFVFKPDDITTMRDNEFNVVRDNVIFELGLFFGRLGKDNVFFVLPNKVEKFHLPTDLLGVLAGSYDDDRNDNNLQAALGPFCNQVRNQLDKFIYENLTDLKSEDKEIKKIAFEKKSFWEMHLTAALLRTRMQTIYQKFNEIQNGYVFRKTTRYSVKEFIEWFQNTSADMLRIVDIAKMLYLEEMEKSWGPPGKPGSIYHIKSFADNIASLCGELLEWEIVLQSIVAPDELQQVPKLMKGWSNLIIDEFTKLPDLLSTSFSEENIAKKVPIEIQLVFEVPPNIDRINSIIENVASKVTKGLLNYE